MDKRPPWITSLCEDAFVSVKPKTSTWMTWWAGCNWEVYAGRRVELLLVSISPLLARYLTPNTSLPRSPLSPPLYSSSSLCLSVRHSTVISNTVCTFDRRPWIMVFRFFKVAWICARAENGKQTQVHHPLFLLSSNVFRFKLCHAFSCDTPIPWWPQRQNVSLFYYCLSLCNIVKYGGINH